MGDAGIPQDVDTAAVLACLTLEEKISLLAGADFWQTVPIPEKGVPSVKVSDGPNGARGAAFKGGPTAACFPASVLLAATWDVDAAKAVGNALADEARSKGARALLAPTVCPHRHPLGGRNFESFSEDPLLAGRMAAQYVQGLQEKGVAATIKHFAANEQETSRFTVDATVPERALREIYLKPFEIAVKEAQPWAIMTSYNLLNGHHADSNEYLLQRVLRGDWGWKGLVMSDWGGTNSTIEALQAGLDLEMPGPTRARAVAQVADAVRSGQLAEEVIDQRALNVLDFLKRLNCFVDPTIPDEQAINRPDHQALIRAVGSQGIVLLKNKDQVLPIRPEKLPKKKIALLGFAREALIHGGGSASVNAHYRVTPEEGLKAALGDEVEFVYSKGAHTFRQLPVLKDNVVDEKGQPGWTLRLTVAGSTAPTETNVAESTYTPVFIKETYDDCRATAHFTPTVTGTHYLAMSGLGRSKLFIDGKEVYEQDFNCPDAMAFMLGGFKEPETRFRFEAGQTYKIEIHTERPTEDSGFALFDGYLGFRFGFMTEEDHDRDLLTEAVQVAREADLAIVFTGHTPDWETEGQDQHSFHLPSDGSLDRLIEAVSAVNAQTVVVNSTGVAVAMPWLDNVQAVVQAWFTGQEAGNAIADVLTGAVNPSGRLPVSFPYALEDAPAYGNFPGEVIDGQLRVTYEEGVFMGYRHYDRNETTRATVLFPFGYGLSYTEFAWSDTAVARQLDDGAIEVSVEVTNTGARAGTETVQVYAGSTVTQTEQPVKELMGFTKVPLQPGETKTAVVRFSTTQLAHFDETTARWQLSGGEYTLSVGKSVRDIVATAGVSVEANSWLP
ncbi:hypothetical protein ASPZODRAFT_137174 [Penicilliopsis zonata CBS 506.65]|uniref:beta-glucosidase n=1 Tax=Penicilliopsis zonata CBS 506.65 TaxID=1073090 RepID=A0A1L9S5X5_9EURO|nr:hypothetical protein ASPZODRAFT_137174 [Penicilliopsis zonata CBS 506.65]OJJ42543.1 hypothetical protein ASPZODRAFT_137174 [Penicilliopsis zonata CBS 506.65]